jgi:hypothetical protein
MTSFRSQVSTKTNQGAGSVGSDAGCVGDLLGIDGSVGASDGVLLGESGDDVSFFPPAGLETRFAGDTVRDCFGEPVGDGVGSTGAPVSFRVGDIDDFTVEGVGYSDIVAGRSGEGVGGFVAGCDGDETHGRLCIMFIFGMNVGFAGT